MAEDERRKQYDNDVVWVSKQEIGFDYLRDHLSMSKEGVVLGDDRVERFCLVDEADSIFIDEARTPLIISESVDADGTKFANAKILADNLQPKLHYDVDVKKKNAVLTEQCFMDPEKALGVDSLFEVKDGGSWVQYVLSAVMAKELFKPDVDYTVHTIEGEMKDVKFEESVRMRGSGLVVRQSGRLGVEDWGESW
jgi:preprotein translocase subunit SecA